MSHYYKHSERQDTMHETYAAITKGGRFEQGMKGAWRGSVRCVFDGEVARCNHRHATRSTALACGQAMRDSLTICPELEAVGVQIAPGTWAPVGVSVTTLDECEHENTRQIDEHDVECLDCGLVSA